MVIFKYNLKKYFRTVSTWILLLFGIAITVLVSMVFTNSWPVNSTVHNSAWSNGNIDAVTNVYIFVTPILVVIIAIFAAFKSVQLFRDEINEGSLLLLVSKPISRKRILIQKWFSLITIFIIFITPILVTQTIILLHFINYQPAYKMIWWGLLGELFVTTAFFALLSSVSLIISLRLGVKSVLGLSFACTLLMVISSSIQTLSYHSQFTFADPEIRTNSESAGSYSRSWNLKTNKTSTLPSFFVKHSDKKPLFNKLWPLALGYQINQMNSLFIKDRTSKQNQPMYENGYNKMMKVKTSTSINFNDYNNSLFLSKYSQHAVKDFTNYFNNNNYTNTDTGKTDIISDYLSQPLADAQTYLTAKLKQYTPPSNIANLRVLSLTLNDFKTSYPASAAKFFNVASTPKIYTYFWNYKFDYDRYSHWKNQDFNRTPAPNSKPTNEYNANSIFNLLLNYHISKTSAQVIIDKKIDYFVFEKLNKYNGNKDLYNYNNLRFKQDFTNSSIDHKTIYETWANSHALADSLVAKYNNIKQLDNEHKLVTTTNSDLAIFNKYFYKVKFENYVNPYLLSIFYLGMAGGLVPLTYWWFSRSDFS